MPRTSTPVDRNRFVTSVWRAHGGWVRAEKEWVVPVGGETLRAPVGWILVPLFMGLGLGRTNAAEIPETVFWGIAAGGFFVAYRSREALPSLLWIVVGGFALGWGLGKSIRPPDAVLEWRELPRREVTLDLEMRRVQERDRGDHWGFSGWGTVVRAPNIVAEVEGGRVWVGGTVQDRLELPSSGATVRVKGVLEGFAGAGEGYREGLFQSGYWFGLGRTRILEELSAPGRIDRILNELAVRVQKSLSAGATDGNPLVALETSILLGWKHLVEPEVRDRYRVTGVIHVMAVSGLHVGMVLIVVWRIARVVRFEPRTSLLVGLGVSLLHVLVTGAPPSAVRAYLMAVILSLGPLLGRRYDPVSAIAVSALLVAVCFPHQVQTLGFQLSYLVVGAIVLWAMPVLQWMEGFVDRIATPLAPPEENVSMRGHLKGLLRTAAVWIGGLFVVGVAAFVVSVPLTMDGFGTLPWAALLVNPIVVPLASIVLLHGVLAVGFGLIGLTAISGFLNHGAWLCLAGMEAVVGWAAETGWNRTGVSVLFEGEGLLLSVGVLGLMLAFPPVIHGRLVWTASVPILAGFGSIVFLG